MVMGTPKELYDADTASTLLAPFGSACLGEAQKYLLNTGVLSKAHKNARLAKPGRTLKISDAFVPFVILGFQLY